MGMIKGIWESTKLICGNHDCNHEIEMVIKEGPHSLFYSCPKYYPENREEQEKPCFNRITLVDYEKMLNHISDIIIEADEMGEVLDLNHYKWKSKGIDFEILKYNNNELIIKMLNRKSLAKSKG